MSGADWIPPGSSTPRLSSTRPSLLGTTTLSGSAILVDVSGSMASIDDNGTLRRIDRLASILQDVLRDAPGARVVTFGDQVRELVGFEPGAALRLHAAGGTPLAEALELVATWQARPGKIVVLSDGAPDDGTRALAVARILKPAIIHALYRRTRRGACRHRVHEGVGPDGRPARDFRRAQPGRASRHQSAGRSGPAAALRTGPRDPRVSGLWLRQCRFTKVNAMQYFTDEIPGSKRSTTPEGFLICRDVPLCMPAASSAPW